MKRFLSSVLSMCTVFALMPVTSLMAEEAEGESTLRILFTDDLHDQLESCRSYNEDGELKWFGGYSYLKSTVDAYRTESSVLVDAGDFSTGNLYSSLFESDAPDLTLMETMGYDAVALGEGEFLYGSDALASMISVPESVPALLCSNIEVTGSSLKSAWDERGLGTALIEKEGVTIGVFSLINEDSAWDNVGNYSFTDIIETAETCVKELSDQGAEVIICLSHCCTEADQNADRTLAEQVNGIDVIISGHTYAEAKEAETVNGTVIVSSGTNGKYLGVLDYDWKEGTVVNYELAAVNSDRGADETVKNMISEYASKLNSGILSGTGYTTSSVLSRTNFSFDDSNAADAVFGESNTADLIADAYIEFYKEHQAELKEEAARIAAEEAEENGSEDNEEQDESEESDEEETSVSTFSKEGILMLLEDAKESWIEILNGGLVSDEISISDKPIALIGKTEIKNTFYEGNITASDVYRVLSSGTKGSADNESSLVTAYMTGNDLRMLCELDVAYGRSNPEMQFYFGDLEYDYNDNRIAFNKVTEVRYRATTDYFVPVSSNTYYPVIMSLDLARKINSLFDETGSGISVSLCMANGKKASSSSLLVITENGEAVSQWKTVAEYIDSFGREGSVGYVDSEYRTPVHEKNDATSMEWKSLLKNTSVTGWKYYGELLLKALGILIIIKVISGIFRRTSLKKNRE